MSFERTAHLKSTSYFGQFYGVIRVIQLKKRQRDFVFLPPPPPPMKWRQFSFMTNLGVFHNFGRGWTFRTAVKAVAFVYS